MPKLSLLTLTSLLLGQIISLAKAQQQQCYYPNGKLSSGDIPCGDGVTHSHCCGFNSICLSNQLCLRGTGAFELSRASCTDLTWQSEKCPSYCANVSIDGGIPLGLYSFNSNTQPQFCCGTSVATGTGTLGCAWSANPFTIEPGSIIPDRGILKNYVSLGSEKLNSTSTGSNHTLASVGVGVGIPLGLFSVAALSWALWERHHRRIEAEKPKYTEATGDTRMDEKTQTPQGDRNLWQLEASERPVELRQEREPVELY